MKILIVEDDPVSRKILKKNLQNTGCELLTAENGIKAWDIISKDQDIRLVLTGWMMPGMSGLELCKKIRETNFPKYVYIILLTAKSQKEDIIEGLKIGADDYMTKPFEFDELQVRINTGIRFVQLNSKLREANEIMRKNLESGRTVQQSLLPREIPDLPTIEFAARFYPSLYVSGDIYNVFRLDEKHFGFYNIDVSGHGVPAALFSVGISQRLNNDLYPHALLKIPLGNTPHYQINSPERVARLLDEDDMLGKYDKYFTMVYAIINIESFKVDFYRAGHNLPLLIHPDGSSEYIDGGGPPIGLGLPHKEQKNQTLDLSPGNQFIIFSDGINEAVSQKQDSVYGFKRVKTVLSKYSQDSLGASFDRLIEDVKEFQGSEEFTDDISIIGFKLKEAGKGAK
jgi:sigma-B regulation protein RsbU (phosphoserine phosphatase)